MSFVESITATFLTQLQKFPQLKEQQRLILLRDCYTYMGSNLMRALSLLEYSAKKISITEYQMFFVLVIERNRFILFKDKVSLVDADVHRVFKFCLECSCEEGWNRKTEKKAPFLCLHQILLYLVQATNWNDITIQKGIQDNLDDLGELLLSLK